MTLQVGSATLDYVASGTQVSLVNPITPVTQAHVDSNYVYVVMLCANRTGGTPISPTWTQTAPTQPPTFVKLGSIDAGASLQELEVWWVKAAVGDAATFVFDLNGTAELTACAFSVYNDDGNAVLPHISGTPFFSQNDLNGETGNLENLLSDGTVINTENLTFSCGVVDDSTQTVTVTAHPSMTELTRNVGVGDVYLQVQYERNYVEASARYLTVDQSVNAVFYNIHFYAFGDLSGSGDVLSSDIMGQKRIMTPVPDIINSYVLDNIKSYWGIIVPEATTNLIDNPSFENGEIDPWVFSPGVTPDVSIVTGRASRGARSARMTAGLDGYGRFYLDITLGALTTYTFSCDIWEKIGNQYSFVINPFGALGSETWTATSTGWQRRFITFVSDNSPGVDKQIYIDSVLGNNPGLTTWIDGVQLEAKGYPTTYCDGSIIGYSDRDYVWDTGASDVHNSTSSRSGNTRHGGRVIYLEDAEFQTMVYTGLGMAPVDVSSTPLGTGGELYTGSR